MTTMSNEMQPKNPNYRPTMRNVADLAGVGIKTVSRVMNNEPNVSEATRERVLKATRQLNYQLDIAAGSLKRTDRKTMSIGLLLPNVANPFSSEINRAIEDIFNARGIAVFAASLDDDAAREASLITAFLGRRVDGLILTPIAANQAYLIPEHSRDLPMVFIDREPRGIQADAVVTDNADGARRAAAHLLAQGHTRFAYLGDRFDIQTAQQRQNGFFTELEKAGIDTELVPTFNGVIDEESARQIALGLINSAEPPTAIFSAQNIVTFGVLHALKETGKNHEIALVGFDDFLMADMLEPGVTVIAQHPGEIGRIAAERLLARIDGDEQPSKTYIVPSELIVRGSGEIPPAA